MFSSRKTLAAAREARGRPSLNKQQPGEVLHP